MKKMFLRSTGGKESWARAVKAAVGENVGKMCKLLENIGGVNDSGKVLPMLGSKKRRVNKTAAWPSVTSPRAF